MNNVSLSTHLTCVRKRRLHSVTPQIVFSKKHCSTFYSHRYKFIPTIKSVSVIMMSQMAVLSGPVLPFGVLRSHVLSLFEHLHPQTTPMRSPCCQATFLHRHMKQNMVISCPTCMSAPLDRTTPSTNLDSHNASNSPKR